MVSDMGAENAGMRAFAVIGHDERRANTIMVGCIVCQHSVIGTMLPGGERLALVGKHRNMGYQCPGRNYEVKY